MSEEDEALLNKKKMGTVNVLEEGEIDESEDKDEEAVEEGEIDESKDDEDEEAVE
jgi:hypothetical protein